MTKLPTATTIMAALRDAGIPKSLPTVRAWTSGKVTVPVWAVEVIADHIATSADEATRLIADLTREFARRWHAHYWRER